jgi:hypothetical protein
MRFFEFVGDDDGNIDKFIIALKNQIGRAASKRTPAKLNWNAVAQMSKDTGFEMGADYETFKSMFDTYPILQSLVKNFDANGIELKVPGAPDSEEEQSPQTSGETSQDKVDAMAASAAPQQLAAQA